MAEVQGEFKDLYFKKNTENSEIEAKSCKIIYSDDKTKAYLFQSDSQIWVYYTDKQDKEGTTKDNAIIDGDQLVKLTIKKRVYDIMYVDFINTHVVKLGVEPLKLGEIIEKIKNITSQFHINKIVLQDDAHFYCGNKSEHAVKALHLRALDKKYINNLSIYQSYNFCPTKEGDVRSCVEALRSITFRHVYVASHKILESLKAINYTTTSVYQIHVQHTDLQVSYTPIKSHKIRLGPIFTRYRENLIKLSNLLGEFKDQANKPIYEFCKIEKNCKEQKVYERSSKFFSYLENDVNMHVIIVEGDPKVELEGQAKVECDVNKPLDTVIKNPINITKLFNLFYGTFKKLDYLYNEMYLTLKERC
jgi:hypothetical protein